MLNRRRLLSSGVAALAGAHFASEGRAAPEDIRAFGGPTILEDRNLSINSAVLSNNANLTRLMSVGDAEVQRPWEFYASAFSNQLRGSNDWSSLHLSVAANYLDWDHTEYGAHYFLTFADQLPLLQGRYAPGPLRFYEAYRFLVTSYALEFAADPKLQALAREKAYILEVTLRDYNDGWNQVGNEWMNFNRFQRRTFPPNRWKSFDEWYAASWSKKMVVLQDRITIATAEYQSVMNQMGLGNAVIAEAISNVANDAYFTKAKAENGTELRYPLYTTDHKFSDFVDSTKAELRKNPDVVGFRFQFDYQTGYRTEVQTNFGASGTFSLGGGFALNVGGQWEERSIDTKSKNFSVDVKFAGFQEFTIRPGGWFSPTVLKLIKNGPWVEKSFVKRWIDQGNDVWGAKGLLPVQQLSAYVGIQPRLKISLASHEYNYYRRAYSAGAGVSFFGIRLGGGGGSREEVQVSWNDTTSSLEMVDLTARPVLIGVRSAPMPPTS